LEPLFFPFFYLDDSFYAIAQFLPPAKIFPLPSPLFPTRVQGVECVSPPLRTRLLVIYRRTCFLHALLPHSYVLHGTPRFKLKRGLDFFTLGLKHSGFEARQPIRFPGFVVSCFFPLFHPPFPYDALPFSAPWPLLPALFSGKPVNPFNSL